MIEGTQILAMYYGGYQSMIEVQVIDVDGVSETVDLGTDRYNILIRLQQLVGGYIERVPCYKAENDGYFVLIDEEGLMKNKIMNSYAQEALKIDVVGTIVLIKKEDFI